MIMIRSFIRVAIHLLVWTTVLALFFGFLLVRHFFRYMFDTAYEIFTP